MNSRFLETFIELARTPHLRRVAERLHATPGALSMRIRSLEQELGVELFSLDQKTLTLTDDGRRLQPYAQAVLAAVKDLRQAAQQTDHISGRVRVGVMETIVHTLLPDFVKAMHEALPDVELDLSVNLTTNLIEDLTKGDLDLILCVGCEPTSPYVLTENLVALQIHWVVRKGLVDPGDDYARIFRHRLMTQMSNTAPYNAAVSLVQKLAVDHAIPATAIRISSAPSLATLVALAREGLGIAIVPGLFVKEYLDHGELEVLPLPQPHPLLVAQWHLINASPATLSTAEVVQRVSAAYCARHAEGDWISPVDARIRSCFAQRTGVE